MRRMLIVEDDLALSTALQASFVREGFDCSVAGDGRDGLRDAVAGPVDVVLLDIMLPGIDGREVCRRLRKARPDVSIIMISALGHELDVVACLHIGADDYVTKPFAFEEILARVDSVTRRRGWVRPVATRLGDVVIDLEANVASRNGAPLHLSRRDLDILRYLLERRGKLVTRVELQRLLAGVDELGPGRVLDTYVWRLRRIIEDDPGNPCILVTVHGQGYILRK